MGYRLSDSAECPQCHKQFSVIFDRECTCNVPTGLKAEIERARAPLLEDIERLKDHVRLLQKEVAELRR